MQHVRRIHDLLKSKYGKRMMMWGDIILQHPDKLDQIPKDTIMLTWGYDPRPSFEGQIVPFVKSGYEFFVCPGVDDWSRILPDFGSATVNIQNFVRDGAKHKALGVLNTEWKDDGETLRARHGTATPGAPNARGTPRPPRPRTSIAASAACSSARRAITSARPSNCWRRRSPWTRRWRKSRKDRA